MLTVTDRAAEFLRESLSKREEEMPEALRIVYSEAEGYQLTLDNPKDGDQVFAQEGQGFLLLDAELSEVLADAIVDVQESAQGPRLTLTTNKTPEREPAEEEGVEGEGPKRESAETPAAKAKAAKGATAEEKGES